MDRRRNETGCESTILNPTQTLDHHTLHQQLDLHQTHDVPGRDSNPDPYPPAAICSPNSKTPQAAPPPPPPSETTGAAASIRYRECVKNHAASIGGHVVDGCGEFMPAGEEGTPEALKCAACDCHRNFHRREVEGESQTQSAANSFYPYNPNRNNNHHRTTTTHLPQVPPPLPPPQHHHHRYSHGYYTHGLSTSPSPVMIAFGGGNGAPAESSSEDLNMFHSNAGTQPITQPPFSASKKRFRTKFTQEQKDRMEEMAERLGWKIQKQDEEEVEKFCGEVGVKRQVFKVWMHNNRQAMKKKQL